MRALIGYILFFSAGLACAGAYFYQLHPEHKPETDLPRIRDDMDRAIERGRNLRDAWQGESPPANDRKPDQASVQGPATSGRK
ncbi:MAG: hypothetical protein IT463_09250 [Planctomycetes bacterium]|nr:hypothetical protein [Planctomycetota bacterium]